MKHCPLLQQGRPVRSRKKVITEMRVLGSFVLHICDAAKKSLINDKQLLTEHICQPGK